MRSFLLIVSMAFASMSCLAQAPDFSNDIISAPQAKFFTTSIFGGSVITEVTPWIIAGGWRSYFFVPGSGQTNIYSNPKSLLISGTNFNTADGTSVSAVTTPSTAAGADYKRNYNGIYTAQYVNSSSLGTISLGFCHAENKNILNGACFPGLGTQNTINPLTTINCSDHDTYSGGSPYKEGWDAYHSLLTACWVNNNASTNWGQIGFSNELGPIAWPSLPYRTPDGRKLTNGFRHPTSIQWNDYIYVFVLQEAVYGYSSSKYQGVPLPSYVNDDGRQGGTKVFRVHKDHAQDPAYYPVYYNGSWNSSLPAGFTRQTMLNYTTVAGPLSTSVIPETNPDGHITTPNRFCVARIKNTSYFAGLEEYFDNGQVFVALRTSTDLVNWSGRLRIIYQASNWSNSVLRYPVFLSADGWSNNEIDLKSFYVVGTGTLNNDAPTNQYNVMQLTDPTIPMSVNASIERQSAVLEDRPDCNIFPNPCTNYITVNYNIGAANRSVTIDLFDIAGRKVKTMLSSRSLSGTINKTFPLNDVTNGVYNLMIVVDQKKYCYKIIKSL